jgi:death-on-curing protein
MNRRSVRFLSVDEVVRINEEVIQRYGGSHGILNDNMLRSAIHQPQAAYGGEPLYPDLYAQAASYLISVALAHAFHDGNKRTAFICVVAFLRLNGVRIKVRHRAAEQLVMDVVLHKLRSWEEVREALIEAQVSRQR